MTLLLIAVFVIPMFLGMPLLAKAIGMNPAWAGAWFGGTIDTTAAVVGAGSFYGDEAMKAASVVKMSQNVLIGFVAFILAFQVHPGIRSSYNNYLPWITLHWSHRCYKADTLVDICIRLCEHRCGNINPGV